MSKPGRVRLFWREYSFVPWMRPCKPLTEDSSAVINHLRYNIEDDKTGVAFVYCNYKEKESQTTVNLVASLLQQLVQRQRSVPSKVRSLHQQHSVKRTRPTLAECSELLQGELTACSRVFLVVDALDECDETCGTRRDFISQLLQLPTNTSLMVTSRNLSSIEEDLEQFRRLEIRARDIDVQTYLEGCIQRETRLRRHVRADSTLRTTTLETIVKKVEGMSVSRQTLLLTI